MLLQSRIHAPKSLMQEVLIDRVRNHSILARNKPMLSKPTETGAFRARVLDRTGELTSAVSLRLGGLTVASKALLKTPKQPK